MKTWNKIPAGNDYFDNNAIKNEEMRKIIILTGLVGMLFIFSQCQKEDMYAHFYPEILFMRPIVASGGSLVWAVDPDFKEVSLLNEETEYLLKARISAPNKLAQIQFINETKGNTVLQTVTDFETNSNVRFIELLISDISANTGISVQATDLKGNITTRVFTIVKN